jgi:hypothetical protein
MVSLASNITFPINNNDIAITTMIDDTLKFRHCLIQNIVSQKCIELRQLKRSEGRCRGNQYIIKLPSFIRSTQCLIHSHIATEST